MSTALKSPGPAVPPEVVLDLKDVQYSVGGRRSRTTLLHGVDLQARAGQVTALLGPNGAGKTTTLGIAQGSIRPERGTVRVLEEDPWRGGPALRSRVGVMLQEGGLPPSATPRRLLAHVCSLYREPVDMPGLVDRLGIDEFDRRDIRRLSGGQRQRVALAAALAGRPELVFLDEPSAGLDPLSRRLVFEVIEELREAGVGIVLTTHLLDDAQRLADQVVLLRRGRVERVGTVSELTATTAQTPLTFQLAQALTADQLAALPSGLQVEPVESRDGERRYLVLGADSPAGLVQLTRWWERMDLMPTEVHLARRSLEDVFLEVAP